MTGAALTQGDAWKKCLTYTKAIFSRIYEVRTVSSDRTPGSMLYGMLLSTELLAAFAALGWIRHPDISSALVVAEGGRRYEGCSQEHWRAEDAGGQEHHINQDGGYELEELEK